MSSTPIGNNLRAIGTNLNTFSLAWVRFGINTVEHLLVNPLKDTAFHLVLWPQFYAKNRVLRSLHRFTKTKESSRLDDFNQFLKENITTIEDKKTKTIREKIILFSNKSLLSLITPYPLNKHFVDAKYRGLYSDEIVPTYHKNKYRNKDGDHYVNNNSTKGPIVRHLEYQTNVLLFRPLGYIEKDLIGVPAKISKIIVKKAFSTFVGMPAIYTGKLAIKTLILTKNSLLDMRANSALNKANKAYEKYQATWGNADWVTKKTNKLPEQTDRNNFFSQSALLKKSDIKVSIEKALTKAENREFYYKKASKASANKDFHAMGRSGNIDFDLYLKSFNNFLAQNNKIKQNIAFFKESNSLDEIQTAYTNININAVAVKSISIPEKASDKEKIKLYKKNALSFLKGEKEWINTYSAKTRATFMHLINAQNRVVKAQELSEKIKNLPTSILSTEMVEK